MLDVRLRNAHERQRARENALERLRSKEVKAGALLILAVVLFVFNGELMQIETEDAFKQPAILIWLCHVLMVVLLARAAPTAVPLRPSSPAIVELSVQYFICNWLFVVALPLIGVGVTNALYQGSMVFVYALSIPLLRERPTAGKTAAVLLSCCGLALLVPSGDASADGGDAAATATPARALAGWGVGLASSVSFAWFKVRFKLVLQRMGRKEAPDSAAATLRLLGLIGACHLLYLWPILLLLHVTGAEPIGPAPTLPVAAAVLLTATIAVAVNVMSQRALALTSPLFMSVGFAASIPAATLADVALRQLTLTWAAGVGMLLIISSQIAMAACADGNGVKLALHEDACDEQVYVKIT